MKLKLEFDIPKSNFNLNHSDSIVLAGSCFSDNIGQKLPYYGFDAESNSFGTLFHPIALANVINASITDSTVVNSTVRDELYLSWDCAGLHYASSHEQLEQKIIAVRKKFKSKIENCSLLVVTFGTAVGYLNKEIDVIVGNCHKAPSDKFERELTSLEVLKKVWLDLLAKLKSINPEIKIVFTVSPVRHVKDGLVENSRSKARLLELINHLVNNDDMVYFPAYEIVMDELRDYRFYKEDLIHPNSISINYIWERFSAYIFCERTLLLNDTIQKLRIEEQHKSLFPNSKSDKERLQSFKIKLSGFLERNPAINWL